MSYLEQWARKQIVEAAERREARDAKICIECRQPLGRRKGKVHAGRCARIRKTRLQKALRDRRRC